VVERRRDLERKGPTAEVTVRGEETDIIIIMFGFVVLLRSDSL
jgi:hypothetical protein